MPGAAHAPAVFLKAGSTAMFSDACRAAIANCGFNPDHFGTYKSVQNAQKAARKDLQAKAKDKAKANPDAANGNHLKPCEAGMRKTRCRCHESPLFRDDPETAELARDANSESGHVLQNAVMQAPGGRNDPCMNEPGNPPEHVGSSGYDCNKAFCMPHHGKSTVANTMHGKITLQEGELNRDLPNMAVDQAMQSQMTEQTLMTALTGDRYKYDVDDKGNLTNLRKDPAHSKTLGGSQPEGEVAQNDQGSEQSAGATPDSLPSQPGDDLNNDQKEALECIKAAYEAHYQAMQNEAVGKYGPGKASAQNRAFKAWKSENPDSQKKSWNELSDAEKKSAAEARCRQLENRPPPKGIAPPQPSSTHKTGKAKTNPKGPTKNECREYQAMQLYANGTPCPPPGGAGASHNSQKFPPSQGNNDPWPHSTPATQRGSTSSI